MPTLLTPDSVEALERRFPNAKHFLNPDGSLSAICGAGLHYRDEFGTLRDADRTYRPNGSGGYIASEDEVVREVVARGRHWFVTALERSRGRRGMEIQLPEEPTVEGPHVHFVQDGVRFRLSNTVRGMKLLGEVGERLGQTEFGWRVALRGVPELRRGSGGGLSSDAFAIPRGQVHGANGEIYPCEPWELRGNSIVMGWDDTELPAEAFPYTIDPAPTFPVVAGADDGYVGYSGSSYGATSTFTSDSAGTTILPRRTAVSSWFSSTYYIYNALLRIDTSSLPDSSTVRGSMLQIAIDAAASNANSRSLTADWYNAWDGAYTSAHYIQDAQTSALAGVPLSTFSTAGASYDLDLLNSTNNVNRAGYTALRLHIDGASPSGENSLPIASVEHATLNEPRLIVDYDDPLLAYRVGSVAL